MKKFDQVNKSQNGNRFLEHSAHFFTEKRCLYCKHQLNIINFGIEIFTGSYEIALCGW